MKSFAKIRTTAISALIAFSLATTAQVEAATPVPLSAVSTLLADHYGGTARSNSPEEKERIRAEIAFYSAAISASMTLVDAMTSIRIYNENHGVLNMAGLGNPAEARLDSTHPFTNEKRIQACNREIREANDLLQTAYRSYAARYPNSVLLRDFRGVSTYLADGSKRASASPSKPAFAADNDLADQIKVATYSAYSSGQGNELYQRIKRAALIIHVYGVDSFKNPAPSAELTFHEATRDVNSEKAAFCLPPGYTQSLRNSNMRNYFQLREELVKKLEKL